MYTYLLLEIFTLLLVLPFLYLSRDKIHFIKNWKILFLSILISSIPFLVWDYIFTKKGIWGFNHEYLIGIKLINLPIEEIIFFWIIPFACLFILESVLSLKLNEAYKFSEPSLITIGIFSAFVSLINSENLYTFLVFGLLSLISFINIFIVKPKFLIAYLISYCLILIPFLITNGILTNGLDKVSDNPVVYYNNDENLGIRINGIPLEDFVYTFLMILFYKNVYDYFRVRDKIPYPNLN